MPGVVFSEPTSAGLPKPIEWHESKTGKFWFGWHAPNPPGPDDLRNGVDVDGWEIELGDGRFWKIPRVLPCRERILTRRSGLPYLIGLRDEPGPLDIRHDDGDVPFVEFIDPQYHELVEDAQRLRDHFAEPENEKAGAVEAGAFAVKLLQVCYCIRSEEIAALDLIGKACGTRMILAAIDAVEIGIARMSDDTRETLERGGVDEDALMEMAAGD